MAKATSAKKKKTGEQITKTQADAAQSKIKKYGHPAKVAQIAKTPGQAIESQKNSFEKKFGEGTAFDLDYGKLFIIGLCIYIAFQVS